MNLKVGDTIWLNVSRKLLKNKKWLEVPFEQMPEEVQKECRHHSHTHPNATVTSSTTSHGHTLDSTASNACSLTGSTNHSHGVNYPAANSHSHTNTILSFGSANLGSPNWWVHVHAITLVSMDSGGTAHTHTQTVGTSLCDLCEDMHSHISSGNTGSGGKAHTHTIPAGNTDNATQAGGSSASHVHPFTTATFVVYSHNHSMGIISTKNCFLGKSHTHTHTGTVATNNHTHTASGTSASGGEGQTGQFFQMF